MSRFDDISDAGLLQAALMQRFLTPENLRRWVVEQRALQRLVYEIAGSNMASQSMSLARLIFAFGLTEEALEALHRSTPRAPEELKELDRRLGLGQREQQSYAPIVIERANAAASARGAASAEAAVGQPEPSITTGALTESRLQGLLNRLTDADAEGARVALERIRGGARFALEHPHRTDLAPLTLRRLLTLATLDLSRISSAQLRHAEARHHLHQALREADHIEVSSKDALTPSLREALSELLSADPALDPLKLPQVALWAWARAHIPPP